MIGSSRSYAIGMAHFQLGGGWRTVYIVLGVYMLLFFGGVGIFYYEKVQADAVGQPFSVVDASGVLLMLLMVLQGFALLLVGGARVSNAIRLDLSSNMIESHRLMPISSGRAIWGYLVGPTTAVILFSLLNALMSVMFGTIEGQPLERMLINQGVIFAFAFFVWSITAMGTFVYRQIFGFVVAGIFLGTCARLMALAFVSVPGLSLLMTPFTGETIFTLGAGRPVMDVEYAVGIAGQAALFLIFFAASCRLYRGIAETAFSTLLGTLLLTVWAGISAVGIGHSIAHPQAMGRGFGIRDVPVAVQVVASLATCIVLSVTPLWAFVRQDRLRPRSGIAAAGVVALTACLVCLPIAGATQAHEFNGSALLVSLLSAGAQVTVVYAMLRIMRGTKFILAMIVAGGVMGMLWFGPLVLEAMRINWFSNGRDMEMSVLGYLSPIALLAQKWSSETAKLPAVQSLVWQWIAAGLALGLVALSKRAAAARARKRGFLAVPALPVAVAVKAEIPQFESPSHGAGSGQG